MKRSLLLIAVTALLCSTAGAQDQRFENPPKEARPYVWWHWINGNTSKDGIRKDLEWMNRIGIAGIVKMGVDEKARGEILTLEQFAELSDILQR